MENIFHLSLDLLGLSTVPGLEVGGYLDSMLNSVPPFYYLTLATSFLIVGLSICFKMERDRSSQKTNEEEPNPDSIEDEDAGECFDIGVGDEVEFVPLVSEEEDRRIAEEIAPKSKYIELDHDHPTAHLKTYLDLLHDTEEEEEDTATDLTDFRTREDLGQYVTDKELHVLDDPRESPSRRGSVISRVKKARQRAIRNAVERNMNADDRLKEQMVTNQTLARVYSIMRENKEAFGDTSFEDVKAQMDLYKA